MYPDLAEVKVKYCETFPDVYAELEGGTVDRAIVAISNNRLGYIAGGAHDYLLEGGQSEIGASARISGETFVRIGHALLAPAGATIGGIREVHSQPPALGQCGKYLGRELRHALKVEQDDTALSARLVAKWGDPTKAAIASEAAGRMHGLEVLQANIQDDEHNITRFVELRRAAEYAEPLGANKSTMLVTTAQRPGSLLDVLVAFAGQDINLVSIQSQLIPNSAFREQFWFEYEAGASDKTTKAVLKELHRLGDKVTMLGSYAAAPIPIGQEAA